MKLRTLVIITILFTLLVPTNAQDNTTLDFETHTWDIFIERNTPVDGTHTLIFVDILTGDSIAVETQGERYTPLRQSIIFFDPTERQVKLASPDRNVQNHPFVNLPADARRIDWVVSKDHKTIAWTLTYANNNVLTTRTYLANGEGGIVQEVLVDGPRENVRALPIAFSEDNSVLFMDTHPDGISQFAPYTQYAGLFALDLVTLDINLLPGEPACFCGAGFGAGMLLRLALNDALDGFDVNVYSVDGGEPRKIEAITRRNYTQAGDILVTDDGTFAVYALSQVRGFGTVEQIVRTVFIQVDLLTLEQVIINNPITTFVHPVLWTEDNTAILFTSEQQNGTWKINVEDGQLVKVANATYIGQLHNLD